MCVHASIEPLIWESDFFQFKSAKLQFSDNLPLITQGQLNEYQLVQAKIPAARLDLADSLFPLGFQLAQGEIDFAIAVAKTARSTHKLPTTRLALAEDIALLKQVARKAFTRSRFRSPWYQAEDSGRFYATWAENAVLGTFDHCCLLALNDNHQPQGFVTLRTLTPGQARLGLLAVFPEYIGAGVGDVLMLAALDWCHQHAIQCLWMATQSDNLAAQHLFQRHGAQIASSAYWLYRGQHDPI